MANLDLLFRSISYIEDHLTCDMQTEEIAKACYSSKSGLEKVFKESAHFSVHDYIVRRRMMKAAKMMSDKPEMSLLDIAVEFGYSSHEAFTRTFYKVWNCNPSEFKTKYGKKGRIPELFPMITGIFQEKGEPYMRRAVDISEMYDFIKERKDCYIVCADINHLIPINEISHKAGDIALSETMKRLLDCSNDEDVAFRFGHDEFALITNSKDITYAENIRNKLMELNGKPFIFEDKKIPLNLYAVITKLEAKTIRYDDIFASLLGVIKEEKERVSEKKE